MLRLSDFVMGKKRFYNLNKGLRISGLEYKGELKFSM